MIRWKTWSGLASALAVGALVVSSLAADGKKAKDTSADDPKVEAARKEVKMLDDLYKTAVVLITENYVEEDSDLPAGSAAKALFEAMRKKGWHEVRLLDATGKPIEADNAPADAFEKSAVDHLKKGETYVDEVQTKDGKRVLRAATPIPVVLDKCAMCHDHYKQFKKDNKIIGVLGYTLPID